MYVVTVTFRIRAEDFDAFRSAVVQQATNSIQKEVGCHLFDVCVAESGPTIFLYEIYSDRVAFDLHLQSEHFQEFDALTAPWIAQKSVRTWQLLEHTA